MSTPPPPPLHPPDDSFCPLHPDHLTLRARALSDTIWLRVPDHLREWMGRIRSKRGSTASYASTLKDGSPSPAPSPSH